MKQSFKLASAMIVATALFAETFAGTAADSPRSITVATQNIYQGTELEHVLSARSTDEFVQGVATDYDNVIATDFAARADALANELAQSKPALVGLQEVARWEAQPLPSYDFLQILLGALTRHGMHYAAIVTRDNFGAAGPGLFPGGLVNVTLTERSAIIARTDLASADFVVLNPQAGAYQHVSVLPTLNGPFPLGAGWLSVDAKVRGRTIRFITTHLDGFSPTVAGQQVQELLSGPGAGGLPVILAGDFNSTSTDPAYSAARAVGFTDEWLAANPDQPGLTCCQVPPDSIVNPVSNLSSRIDYVFARGLLAPREAHLIGADPSARTPSGLWPSDHAGLVATLGINSEVD